MRLTRTWRGSTAWKRPDEAEQKLCIAETYVESCGSEFAVEQLVSERFYTAVAGRPGEAMKMVQEVLAPGRPGSNACHKAHASWVAATVAVKLRHPVHAAYFVGLAIQ